MLILEWSIISSLDYLMYRLRHWVMVISNFLASNLKTVSARLALEGWCPNFSLRTVDKQSSEKVLANSNFRPILSSKVRQLHFNTDRCRTKEIKPDCFSTCGLLPNKVILWAISKNKLISNVKKIVNCNELFPWIMISHVPYFS